MDVTETCACRGCRPGVGGYLELDAVRAVIAQVGALGLADDLARIVELEWFWFDAVQGLEGRAGCQDDARSFLVYRLAQYLAFPHEVVPFVRRDAEHALDEGRNLIEEKYARMMRATDPERYARTWERLLGETSPVRETALADVADELRPMVASAAAALPESARHARVETSVSGAVSALDYFLSEVAGYSLDTLWRLAEGLRRQAGAHVNPIALTYEYSVLILNAIQGGGSR